MQISDKNNLNRRKENRFSFSGFVLFATNNRLYEGEIENYSKTGLSIKNENFFQNGQKVTVAIPYSTTNNDKRTAEIVWSNRYGFGLKLIND